MFWNILRKESKVWSIFQKQYQQYLCTLDKFLSIIFQNDPVIFKNNWAKNRIWLWMCFVPGSVLKIKHVLSTPLCVCWNTANENIYLESVKNFFFFVFEILYHWAQKKLFNFCYEGVSTVSWNMWIWFQYSTLSFNSFMTEAPII